jgi:hypothetical protein
MPQEVIIFYTTNWDLACYNNKEELMNSLEPITFDKMVSSQLLLIQRAQPPIFFDINDIYLKILSS